MIDSDIRKNFEQTDTLLAILLAKVKATELALATVIASRSDPSAALAIWEQISLNWADEAFEAVTLPAYREQMPKALCRPSGIGSSSFQALIAALPSPKNAASSLSRVKPKASRTSRLVMFMA
jgi:hypothetical protein